jgi:chromosome partitioning protein
MKIAALLSFLSEASSKTQQILQRKQADSQTVEERRFIGDELCEVVGVPLSTIYSAEKAGRIPSREINGQGRKLGYTLAQVCEMQEMWGTSPRRLENEVAQVIAFTAFKGGCWKTNTTWYAGSYYANLGFRVLLVDLDQQASLTENCGIRPDVDTSVEDSLAYYITRQVGFEIEDVIKTIRPTYLSNMDIIPASLGLASCEMSLAAELVRAQGDPEIFKDAFFRVKQCIDAVKSDYDIVLIDGTPSLGILPLNIIFASDTIVVPTPTEIVDFASTAVFNDLYHEQIEFLSGLNKRSLQVIDSAPDIAYLPTRYSDSKQKNTMTSEEVLAAIRLTYEDHALQNAIRKHESAVSNLGRWGRTVFDVNPGQGVIGHIRKPSIINARENFKDVFDEVLEKLILPKWPSRQSIRANKRG